MRGCVVKSSVRFKLMYIFFVVFLVACGGGSSENAADSPFELIENNHVDLTLIEENMPPSIEGSPVLSINYGELYVFNPVVYDPEDDILNFSAHNFPAWLDINNKTGLVRGVADLSDVGAYQNISITVTDGVSVVALPEFSLTVEIPELEKLAEPAISGPPVLYVKEGQNYLFRPHVSGFSDHDLSFSVLNLPVWMSFDRSTGEMRGVPGSVDVGVHKGITLVVTDGINSASMASFDLEVTSTSALLSWRAPSVRADGSLLPLSELSGFRIYSGTSVSNMKLLVELNDHSITEYRVNGLVPGTYYYSVSAYNLEGVEGEFSDVVSKTIE